MRALLSFVIVAFMVNSVAAEPFKNIRIGDQDGFGFTKTKGLLRPALRNSLGFDFEGKPRRSPNSKWADTNGDGVLRQGEFLPDLDGDGRVAWFAGDDFDNRAPEEMVDRNHACRGCLAIGDGTKGSIWTDLALSTGASGYNWPDAGPERPNNATFVFDFTVKGDQIAAGSLIFFNLVYGDYDIIPAIVGVEFAHAKPRVLEIENIGPDDGLIQARSAVLNFKEVFTADDQGNWHGLVQVVFDAPLEPYTAFDFVELSLFQIAEAPGREFDVVLKTTEATPFIMWPSDQRH
ncbi:MAG: hypothetical protein HON14_14515 [Rhodospirillaceae bacterium]|jgi:hypothetical protein|nr:hypothetical protein [Rhodospirillaceae bacterium]MBT4587857.1 hypothetical protein [Rhodospirillaceae bacterium]MBT4940344.1 hypothetical protein [Rhodospirillaceae bacterium]MBT7267390.1 hypothetical protein [Rhodospirillaceae bacterium]